jgi:hypothetical protein
MSEEGWREEGFEVKYEPVKEGERPDLCGECTKCFEKEGVTLYNLLVRKP